MADDNAIAIFHMEPKFNGAKSKTEGRPIYEDVPFVEILIPGNNRDIVNRPVVDDDKRRFPQKWAAFENRQDTPVIGTPVKEVPWLGRAQVAMLEHLNILTIEALADLGDIGLQDLGPGARDLQAKAKSWMEQASEGAVNNAAISDMRLLRARNEELADKVAVLETKLASLQTADDTLRQQRPRRTKPRVEESVDG